MSKNQPVKSGRIILSILAIAVVLLGAKFGWLNDADSDPTGSGPGLVEEPSIVQDGLPPVTLDAGDAGRTRSASSAPADDTERVREAFRSEQSDLIVEVEGVIDRMLSDDLEGDRHQRFIVRLSNGHTVLIAHNIDLADRVPCDEGDVVRIRGEYEYNDQGGVIHWTHHDPNGWHEGGWIRHAGRTYE